VLISILEPENMYIFKNTGTMVIGVSDGLQESQQNLEMIMEESKEQVLETANPEEKKHEFQIVASDTTVF